MATRVIVPVLGEAIAEATLVNWLKHPGDPVSRGDELAELETDKATLTIECPANGVLLEVLVQPGTTVMPGQLLAIVGRPGEQVTIETPVAPTGSVPSIALAIETPIEESAASGDQRVSPAARRMARHLGVDLTNVHPSKPGARITTDDIQRYVQTDQTIPAPAGRAPYHRVELNTIRKTLAGKMLESAQQIPQFSVSMDINANRLLRAKEHFSSQGLKASVSALLIQVVARVLMDHPFLNARFDNGNILIFETVNMAVAVATPQGLVAPVIYKAEKLGLRQISSQLEGLVESARQARLSLDQITEATFTMSNLGMQGVSQFVPLINPPQAAILGVGSARPVILPVPEGTQHARVMTLTVSADHRVLDGETVALFLSDIKDKLENLKEDQIEI